jgi:hypothetical protein
MGIPWSLTFSTDNPAGKKLYAAFAATASLGMLMLAGRVLRGEAFLLTVVCSSLSTYLALFGRKRR